MHALDEERLRNLLKLHREEMMFGLASSMLQSIFLDGHSCGAVAPFEKEEG